MGLFALLGNSKRKRVKKKHPKPVGYTKKELAARNRYFSLVEKYKGGFKTDAQEKQYRRARGRFFDS